MKKSILIAIGLFLASSLWADVVNGNMSTEVIFDASTINVSDDADDGWSAYAASEYDLSAQDMYLSGAHLAEDGYWFGQIYTDNYETYGNGTLSFDMSYITRFLDTSMFKYAIYGTDSTDSTETLFSLTAESSPAGSAWTEIVSDSIAIPDDGTTYTANFTSTAYKYIAVRFRFSGPTPDNGGLAVDNISVVPEPAAAGLLGLGGILTLIVSRIRRKR